MSNLTKLHEEKAYLKISQNLLNAVSSVSDRMDLLEVNTDSRLKMMDAKIDREVAINRNQQVKLQRIVKQRIRELLPNEHEYNTYSRKYFPALWGALRDVHQVTSYCEIPRINFENAIQYVKSWEYLKH